MIVDGISGIVKCYSDSGQLLYQVFSPSPSPNYLGFGSTSSKNLSNNLLVVGHNKGVVMFDGIVDVNGSSSPPSSIFASLAEFTTDGAGEKPIGLTWSGPNRLSMITSLYNVYLLTNRNGRIVVVDFFSCKSTVGKIERPMLQSDTSQNLYMIGNSTGGKTRIAKVTASPQAGWSLYDKDFISKTEPGNKRCLFVLSLPSLTKTTIFTVGESGMTIEGVLNTTSTQIAPSPKTATYMCANENYIAVLYNANTANATTTISTVVVFSYDASGKINTTKAVYKDTNSYVKMMWLGTGPNVKKLITRSSIPIDQPINVIDL